jgi:hypothetical protein
LQSAGASSQVVRQEPINEAPRRSILTEVDDARAWINADRFMSEVTHGSDREPREVVLTGLRQNLEHVAVVLLADLLTREPGSPRSLSASAVAPGSGEQRELADCFAARADDDRSHPAHVVGVEGIPASERELGVGQLFVIAYQEGVSFIRKGGHPIVLTCNLLASRQRVTSSTKDALAKSAGEAEYVITRG